MATVKRILEEPQERERRHRVLERLRLRRRPVVAQGRTRPVVHHPRFPITPPKPRPWPRRLCGLVQRCCEGPTNLRPCGVPALVPRRHWGLGSDAGWAGVQPGARRMLCPRFGRPFSRPERPLRAPMRRCISTSRGASRARWSSRLPRSRTCWASRWLTRRGSTESGGQTTIFMTRGWPRRGHGRGGQPP